MAITATITAAAEAAADPFADAQSERFHGGEYLAAHQSSASASEVAAPRAISEQKHGGADTGALEGRAGQDQAQHGAGAGRPQQACGDAQQQRGDQCVISRKPPDVAFRRTGTETIAKKPPAGG